MAQVWPSVVVEEENLKVHMVALRRALGDEAAAARYIATVSGRGYRFVAPVRREALPSPVASYQPGAPQTSTLPAEVAHIFGRGEAIEGILRDLGESRLVSIVGAGGIGKTTVAVAAAHAASRQHADGAAFIDLAPIGDPAFVVSVMAAALGVVMAGADPLSSVVHALKSQHRLLLIDNCEHLLPAVAAVVDRLIRSLDGIHVLATSREPLRLRGERVVRLRGLACETGPVVPSQDARGLPSFALFEARASERAGYRLTDADVPAVTEICRRLEGNALAIELAATQTARFTPAQMRELLDDRLQLLRLNTTGVPVRQQTLGATLDWSYSLLSAREADVLCAVSVFASAFDFDGALAMSAGDAHDVLDTLSQLAAKSLLVTEAGAGNVTYRLLETTRSYVLQQLRSSGRDRAVRRRHAEHVCTLLERASAEWSKRPADEWGATWSRLLDDLRTALSSAAQDTRERVLLIRLTIAGSSLWNHLSLTHESHAHFSRALREIGAAGLAGSASEMNLQLSLASTTLFTRGFAPEAFTAMQRALEIAEQLGDVDHRLRTLRLMCSHQKFAGQHDAALRTIEGFVALAAAAEPSALPDGQTHLALAEAYVGRLRNSRERLERLRRDHVRAIEHPRFARFLYDQNVDVLNILSQVQWLTGSPDTAAATARAAVDRALKLGHSLSLINALATAACPVLYLCGHDEMASRHAELLNDRVVRHGIVIWRPVALFYRAALACARADRLPGAVQALEHAIGEFEAIHHRARMPFYLAVLAQALARCGRVEDAEATILKAAECARSQNEGWCTPELLRVRAAVLASTGREIEAQAVLAESIASAREMGALSWRLRAAVDLATLWRAQARRDDARRMLAQVHGEFTEGFGTHDLVAAGDLLVSLG
jgi:predicted ATPase